MADQVHLLIRKHRDTGEQVAGALQEASRAALIAACRRPGHHPMRGGQGWDTFQFTRLDMEPTVRYLEDNPAG